MAIYTRKGDKGETTLPASGIISKSNIKLECLGTIDELNSCIGLARAFSPEDISKLLVPVQHALAKLQAQIAMPHGSQVRIGSDDVDLLERDIDHIEQMLPEIKRFILPSGSKSASVLHLARTVCRRAEREMVRLKEKEGVDEEALKYINRLSSFLFELARCANKVEGVGDEEPDYYKKP
ncbi:MAG: cob(I)yrinic acid a,c-diamide adenosyltransferase [Candidatus Aenigmarchaeota archaeon]|nr:cob(I)yrinic acid a,c-diamide adenosyltransferase [Candidatus Aenigmarchaeota archaeon]